jgi:hypothetical protein
MGDAMIWQLNKQLGNLTVIACAVICASAANAAPLGMKELKSGAAGPALSDTVLGGMRGMYLPPGSRVFVQIGNSTFSDVNPNTPGSASRDVVLSGTSVKTFAATGLSGGSFGFSRSFSTGNSIGRSFGISSRN